MSILADLASAFYKPQVNPNAYGVNEQGQIVDKDNNIVPLYQQPNWFERSFDPQAKQIAGLNANIAASPLVSQQNRAQQRMLSGLDFNTLPQSIQNQFPNPNAAITLTGGNFTGSNDLNQLSSLSRINAGLPQLTANADVNTELARGQQMKNEANKAALAGLMGTPSTEALAGDVLASNTLKRESGEGSLIPQELTNKGLGLGNDFSQLLAEQNRLPFVNQGNLNNAIIGAKTSGQGVQDLPLTNLISRADKISGAYQAEHPNIQSSPFSATVDPFSGTIIPGHNVQNTIMGQALNQLGGGGGITAPSGTVYQRPTNQPINPLVSVSSNSLLTPTTSNITTAPQPQLANKWGVGDSITGADEPTTDLPLGADEALKHLNLKLDKDGNLQKVNDWIDITPDQLAQGQKIQNLVKRGKIAPTGKSHTMRKLISSYLGSELPSGTLNQGF